MKNFQPRYRPRPVRKRWVQVRVSEIEHQGVKYVQLLGWRSDGQTFDAAARLDAFPTLEAAKAAAWRGLDNFLLARPTSGMRKMGASKS